MEIVLLIIVISVIGYGTYNAFSSKNPPTYYYNRSERELATIWPAPLNVLWDSYKYPLTKGEEPTYEHYEIEVKGTDIRKSATKTLWAFKARLLKDDVPIAGYLQSGTIYAKNAHGEARKICDFYPSKHAPSPKGWYMSPSGDYTNIMGELELKDLKSGEGILFFITTISI